MPAVKAVAADGYLASVPGMPGAFAEGDTVDANGRVVPVLHDQGKAIRKGTVRAIIREVGSNVAEFMEL